MSEAHYCCQQGLCQEAAVKKIFYWSEKSRPYLLVDATIRKDENDPALWKCFFGDVCGYGKSPSLAADQFDKRWKDGNQ